MGGFEIQSERLTRYFQVKWGIVCGLLAIFFSFSLIPSFAERWGTALLIVLFVFFVLVLCITSMASYLFVGSLHYWIEGNSLRIDEGVVVKRRKSIPLDRITDVQLVQGPLMSAFSIWRIEVQTAGRAQQIAEGILWGVTHPEETRDQIMKAREKALGARSDD